jgi:hypothetical protein
MVKQQATSSLLNGVGINLFLVVFKVGTTGKFVRKKEGKRGTGSKYSRCH